VNEYRTFVEPPNPSISWWTEEAPVQLRTVTLPVPRWATNEMIGNVIRAITRWRYAHTNPTELMVYVPISWLTTEERRAGHGGPSSILGVPLRYAHIPQLLVGVVASGE
jgi:hypothetical protein